MIVPQTSEAEPSQQTEQEKPKGKHFVGSLARAFGGAIIFALPMMMTMEMWWLGFSIDRLRLALLLVVAFPLLIGVSHIAGFEDTFGFAEDVVDVLVAYAVGFVSAAGMLFLFNALNLETSLDNAIGMISLQAIPGSFGALLARSELGESKSERLQKDLSFGEELLLMMVGGLFLALNISPTEEVILIAYKMTPGHAVALALVSMALMHTFVYVAGFRGQEKSPQEISSVSLFLRFTVTGYALVLLTCFYVLWTFGRTTDIGLQETLTFVIVLAFPASIGAAAARLIL
jgi:putative integral membrane protein (TIGR02587 family)